VASLVGISAFSVPAAHEVPLPVAVGYDARDKATGPLAEMLRSRRPEGGGGLTSEGESLSMLKC
jgi:hypothetical protein